MVQHSFQEEDLAVAAVPGLRAVEAPVLEVPVGRVGPAAEAEVGAGARGTPRRRSGTRRSSRSGAGRGAATISASGRVQHRAGGEVAVRGATRSRPVPARAARPSRPSAMVGIGSCRRGSRSSAVAGQRRRRRTAAPTRPRAPRSAGRAATPRSARPRTPGPRSASCALDRRLTPSCSSMFTPEHGGSRGRGSTRTARVGRARAPGRTRRTARRTGCRAGAGSRCPRRCGRTPGWPPRSTRRAVRRRRPVDAQPDADVMLDEELAPGVVDERGVGLDVVLHPGERRHQLARCSRPAASGSPPCHTTENRGAWAAQSLTVSATASATATGIRRSCGAVRQIAVRAVEVAQRRRLHDHVRGHGRDPRMPVHSR